jgi:hypothetical protein
VFSHFITIGGSRQNITFIQIIGQRKTFQPKSLRGRKINGTGNIFQHAPLLWQQMRAWTESRKKNILSLLSIRLMLVI